MSKFYRLLGLLSLLLLTGCTLFVQQSAPALPQVWSGTPVPTAVATLSTENASRVVEIARWGKGRISDLAWTPDGQQLAVGTSTGIFLYDTDTCQQIKYLSTRYGVTNLAYAPDGKMLAVGDESPGDDAHILDAATSQEMRDLRGSAFVSSLAFSPDGDLLVVAGGDNSIEVWDVNTGQKRNALDDVNLFSSAELAVSPDGNTLAVADYHNVGLWNLKSGKLIGGLTPQDVATLVAFSPDGSLLATDACGEQADQTICTAGEIWLWNTSTWKPITKLRGNKGWIESIDFSPDGSLLVSGGSRDHSLKLWDVKTGQLLRSVVQHTAYVTDVAFSPDGSQLASANRDRGVTIWSAANLEQVCLLNGYTDSIKSLSLSSDGTLLATGSYHGVRLWTTSYGTQQKVFTTTTDFNWEGQATLSPAADLLAYGESNNAVQVWNLPRGEKKYTLTVPSDVRDLAFSPDGNLIAAGLTRSFGNSYNPVWLWSQNTGQAVGTLPAEFDAASIAFSPDGKLLAIGTEKDGPIRLGSVATQQEVRSMDGDVGAVKSIVFSPDGNLLAVSYDQVVQTWDVMTGRKLHELSGHKWRVYGVAFSPDGKLLASGSDDQTIRLWDVATGQELQVLSGHANRVSDLAFLPDGTYLISGSDDGTIRLWGIPADKSPK